MAKPKYIVEHDPLSYTGYGAYIIKENDGFKTPYCLVLIPFGDRKLTEKYARAKANKIASALEFQDNISDYLNKSKKNGATN